MPNGQRPVAGARLFLLIVALGYLPLIFLGYGTDSDTYAILEMGRHLRATGEYVPSRDPGYPLVEAVVTALAPLGGSRLTNLVSLGLGLWALQSLLALASGLALRRRILIASAMAVHPLFIVAATSSHDFIAALALILAAARATQSGRPLRAGLWGGMAAACRLQALPVVAGFLLVGAWRQRRRIWWLGLVLMALLVIVAYLPAAAFAGWSLAFLRVGMGDARLWSPWLRLGKFVYKNLSFWGLPAVIVLLVAAVTIGRRRTARWREMLGRPGFAEAAVAVVVTEALFLAFPIERDYLLPVVPLLLLLLSALGGLRGRRLTLLVAALASLCFFEFQVLRPDVPAAATSARPGFWVERGILWQDVGKRIVLRRVDTMEGYVDSLRALRRRQGLGPSAELEALAKPARPRQR